MCPLLHRATEEDSEKSNEIMCVRVCVCNKMEGVVIFILKTVVSKLRDPRGGET